MRDTLRECITAFAAVPTNRDERTRELHQRRPPPNLLTRLPTRQPVRAPPRNELIVAARREGQYRSVSGRKGKKDEHSTESSEFFGWD
jgi:hypothetical protein